MLRWWRKSFHIVIQMLWCGLRLSPSCLSVVWHVVQVRLTSLECNFTQAVNVDIQWCVAHSRISQPRECGYCIALLIIMQMTSALCYWCHGLSVTLVTHSYPAMEILVYTKWTLMSCNFRHHVYRWWRSLLAFDEVCQAFALKGLRHQNFAVKTALQDRFS